MMTSTVDLVSSDDDSAGGSNPPLVWNESAEQSASFKTASILFAGRKHQSPNVDAQRKWLRSLISHTGDDYFTGKRVRWFNELKKGLNASYSAKPSTLQKNWNGNYCSQKLALLIWIVEEEKNERKKKAPKQQAATRLAKKKGGRRKQTDLDKLITTIVKVYTDMCTKHDEEKKKDENKTRRTPSLDHHKSGRRPQDDHMFDQTKASKSACPVCGHFRTMSISSHEELNAENERRRKAANGEGFKGLSATMGCFCYCYTSHECTGDDCGTCAAIIKADPKTKLSETSHKCTCQVTFEENHRHTIAFAVEKNKAKEEEKKKCKCILSFAVSSTSAAHIYFIVLCHT